MKKFIKKLIAMKSFLPVVVTIVVIAGVVVTGKVIDNEYFANNISSQKTLSHSEKEKLEEEKDSTVVETEKELNEATEKVEAAQEKVKNAEVAKQESQKELEKAKEAVVEAEKVLESAKTEQEKIEAQAKVDAAKEVEKKAEQAKKDADEKANQAIKDAEKAEQERLEAEEKANNANQNYSTPSVEETPSPSPSTTPNATPNTTPNVNKSTNSLEAVKNAIENTRNANNMTVTNYTENSTRKFDKTTGEEYAVYRSILSLTDKPGTLYSYKVNTSKTISLFKENGGSEWKMVFSGKRSIGVIELELIKNAYSVEPTGDDSYNVKISYNDAKNWLMNYYGISSVSGDVTIAVKTNGDFVQSIRGTVGNKTINLTLNDIGSTVIPSRSELGIDENTINALEEEYKARYDCERENDHWVCGPNKHVNQYNF